MPLFCILLSVLSMPVKWTPPTDKELRERHNLELKQFKRNYGEDAPQRLAERLRTL